MRYKKKNPFLKEKNYDIGIISFNMNTNLSNFGAALHSFAFQKYLNKKNINNVIINYKRSPNILRTYNKKIKNILKERSFNELIPTFIILKNILIKQYKFNKFFKKNCIVTKHQYDINTLKYVQSINRFVCETDVTWAKFKEGYDRGFLCDLPNMKTKDNIAYSIDFGSKDISEENKRLLKTFAQNFKYISIRNVFKLDYFKNIVQREDIEISIDPVFLLDKKDYLKITKKIKKEKEYLLVYNCKENHPEMITKAKEYAKEKNLKVLIINCYDKNILITDKENPTPIGIEEFLGYIDACKCFFTNSYHGLCFAIIYGIPFYAFARKGNSEKILTILEIFKLYHRFGEEKIINQEIDWEQVNKIWGEERAKAENFICRTIIKN